GVDARLGEHAVLQRQDRVARRQRLLLRHRVEGRVDLQPALVDGLVALVLGVAEHGELRRGQQLPPHLLGEVVVGLGQVLVELRGRRRRLPPLPLGLGQRAGLDHPVDGDVAARLRPLRVPHGVVLDRVADDPGEHRRLADVQLLDGHAEVGLGRGLDPVGVVAEVDGVQVAGEDLLLGHLPLEPLREHDLLDLAVERLLLREQLELHQLLGDGRAALADPALLDVGLEGAQHAPDVVAVVDPEALVLDGDDGVDDVLGDLLELDRLAVLLVLEGGHERAVGGVDVRPLGQRAELDRLGLAGADLAEPAERHRERRRGEGQDDPRPEDDGDESGQEAAHRAPGSAGGLRLPRCRRGATGTVAAPSGILGWAHAAPATGHRRPPDTAEPPPAGARPPDPRPGVTDIAFAGAGWVTTVHALAADHAPDVRITKVASRTPEAARARADQAGATAAAYTDLPGDADIVWVATPPALHRREAERAVAGGALAAVEAPLAATLDDADALVELAGHGQVAYAENLALSPAVAEAVDACRRIGTLTHLEVRFAQGR